MGIEPKISYSTIRNFTSWTNWNLPNRLVVQVEDSARTQSWIELVPTLLGYDISKSNTNETTQLSSQKETKLP